MTPTRLSVSRALPLPLAPMVLALAACGDGPRTGEDIEPSAPFGFELAFAGAEAASRDDGAGAGAAGAAVRPPMIDLTPEELAARLKTGNVRLIDVRTDEEVADGMIPGAEHIPLDRFDPAKLGPDDGREVVLYCRSGRRSAMAGATLAEATGEPVEHLAGGILAWEDAGLPLEKP
jgi:rhodanese-related sulfurtransferase